MLTRENAYETLRAAHLRLTPQRRAVIDVLAGNTTHPLADEVASAVQHNVEGVSLSTVYKTLHELADLGLVREIGLGKAMRFDAETAEHLHFSCDVCGCVHDAPLPESVGSALAQAASEHDVTRLELTAHGVCAECRSATNH